MKAKILIILLSLPLFAAAQELDSCNWKMQPIFSCQGDSVGRFCGYWQPIEVLDNIIDAGEFYQIIVNEDARRVYVLDILRRGCVAGENRFLRILDFSGKVILESDKSNPGITKGYVSKSISIATDGKILLRDLVENNGKLYDNFKLLNKDGILIKNVNISYPENYMSFSNFDVNKNGGFVVICTLMDSSLANDNRIHLISKYNQKGKLIWQKSIGMGLISDIAINDKGKIALLKNEGKYPYGQREVILLNKKGSIIRIIQLESFYTTINFSGNNVLNLRNRARSDLFPSISIDLSN